MADATITWLGGRPYQVQDLRDTPGDLSFVVTSDDKVMMTRVWKNTDLESEIAALVDG